ncbi:hypothetical protein FE697_017370 [Mumia zhuanghuii]|uniref:Uncharacterized protein n=2 Tax=Mumia TaxID=1546255 RepID=A0ABW1QMY1_9ACTN|nr:MULTISPECIES: hypothetical protein [Mumia]KAA1420708.1 hypothetical protein FE697_017370 [Mumia zhuanghuii]
MRLDHAIIAGATAALTGFGGAVAVVQVSNDTGSHADGPSTASPTSSAPTAPTTPTAASTSTAEGLSAKNLVSTPVYFDITGHHFTRKKRVPWLVLGPCTGDLQMGDVVADDVTRIDGRLVGGGDRHVTEQLAETDSPELAAEAADSIVTLVEECDAIQGGDFGYGDPVLVSSEPHHMVWYFPAFDSDQVAGGYVVFNVGTRVGVVEVNDAVGDDAVAQLATQAARIAGE